eukprot:Nitzschia sp. Nitz4//scaffold249_size28687//25899//26549//NITZ4_008120-RA/size28687-processed-gene-0.12-mRNA-1//1//CDS//3329544026//4164//frame0
MSFKMIRSVLVNLLLLVNVNSQVQLTSQELHDGIQSGSFDVIVDVRTQSEWDDGHIMNATFVENLAGSGSADSILGCDSCIMAVYCRTGGRAGQAISRLINEFGFDSDNLYNGLGVSQWTNAGYELVVTESVLAPCQEEAGVCGYNCSSATTACQQENPEGNETIGENLNQDDANNTATLAPTGSTEQEDGAASLSTKGVVAMMLSMLTGLGILLT